MHLTLVFLGEVADSVIAPVKVGLDRVAKARAPFTVNTRGTGTFGSLEAAKVLWAGFDGDLSALRGLQRHIVDELRLLGIPPDYEVFEPHVTLARCKHPRGDASLVKISDSLRTTTFGDLRATEIVFCTDVTDEQGMKYAALSRHPLVGTR